MAFSALFCCKSFSRSVRCEGSPGEDNVVRRNPFVEQLAGYSIFGAVSLNPDLGVENVDVDQNAVDPLVCMIRPDHQHQVVVARSVEDELEIDVSDGERNHCVFRQGSLDARTIPLQLVHDLIHYHVTASAG
jgi:hypothetical protein